PVGSKKQIAQFIDLPHDLYARDPNYVPELFLGQRDLLSPDKHPFYKHSSAQSFLAYKDGRLVGRILAIWNTNHNKFNQVSEGQFGFFESVNDQEEAVGFLVPAPHWVNWKEAAGFAGHLNL